jgi:predicted phage terminase large subunit-like protein
MSYLMEWERLRPKKYVTRPIDKLVWAVTQQCAENGLNLILEAPPRQGKSEIELVYSPAIHLTKNPNFRYLAITHSQDLANKFVTAAGRIVAEEGFQLKTEKANSFKIDGSVSIDASYQGFGIKGAVSGRGANRIILDDVLKSGTEAMSEKVRQSIITDIVSTCLNRIEPFNDIPGAMTILQARLHEADPIGWFIDESELPYVRLHLPARNDGGNKAFVENTYEGTKQFLSAYDALIPGTRPRIDELERSSTPYFFASQQLQEPSLGVDLYFDVSRCPRYQRASSDVHWIACDLANTATMTGSRSAYVCLGYSVREAAIKVLGVSTGRWKQDLMGPELMGFVEAMRRLTGRKELTVIVERAAGGFGIIDRYSNQLHIDAVFPAGSKEERAGAVCYLVNQGAVQLPEDAPWLKNFIAEVSGFPLSAMNDIPDALTHALKFILSQNEFRPADVEQTLLLADPYQEIADGLHDGPSKAFSQFEGPEGW